ncbi:MAG TPA: inositol monophosphatase family protein [Allosphingosinicella sp.]|jgi:myo-inositol-1(or 4)-monophosphatase
MKELLAFAHRLADAARGETLPRWETGCAVDGKESAFDFDPVTDADREGERVMRALIEAEYPDHGVAGEEFPNRPARGPYVWSLDPVDGTRSFICRLPTWVTLIALLEQGRPVLGLIDAPCLGERFAAALGEGLFHAASGAFRLRASGCTELSEARLTTSEPFILGDAGLEGFCRLRRAARTTRYGLDGYAYGRLAAGSLDLVVECCLKPHDYQALVPVVEAAGGVIGNWAGGADLSAGQIIAAATPALFETAVREMEHAA